MTRRATVTETQRRTDLETRGAGRWRTAALVATLPLALAACATQDDPGALRALEFPGADAAAAAADAAPESAAAAENASEAETPADAPTSLSEAAAQRDAGLGDLAAGLMAQCALYTDIDDSFKSMAAPEGFERVGGNDNADLYFDAALPMFLSLTAERCVVGYPSTDLEGAARRMFAAFSLIGGAVEPPQVAANGDYLFTAVDEDGSKYALYLMQGDMPFQAADGAPLRGLRAMLVRE